MWDDNNNNEPENLEITADELVSWSNQSLDEYPEIPTPLLDTYIQHQRQMTHEMLGFEDLFYGNVLCWFFQYLIHSF